MTTLRTRVGTAAAVGALALTAAACSSGGGKSTSGSGGSANSGSSGGNAPSADVPTNVVRPSTTAGGTLRVGLVDDFDSLDPARAYYALTWNFDRLLDRGLLMYDAKPGPAGTATVGDLATGPATAENGGKTWTYHLKDGVKFEDGTAVTSKDVKYGIERVFATSVVSGGPTYVICLLTKCDSTGASTEYQGPYKDTSPGKLGLKSVVTPDDKTITFNLVKPFSDWNYLMTLPDTTPVPIAKDTRDKYAQHPVATGPYKLTSYQPGKNVTLVRNTQWSKATDSVRTALPDRVEVTEGLQSQDLDNRILAGDLDFDLDAVGVQTPTQAKILRNPTLKADQSLGSVADFLNYVSIQTKVAPFDNVHCRRAVQYATDKTSVQTALGGPITGGKIATGLFPPLLKGYQPGDPYPNGAGDHGDLAKAKSELATCGQPNGFSTTMATFSKLRGPAVATAMQQSLSRVGIKVNIDPRSSSTYYSNDIGTPANVKSKGYGLADAAWGPDWPAPYGYVESIVDGRAIKQQGNSNYSELNDPKVNADIDQGLAATDPAQSLAAFSRIDPDVMADANIVPLTYAYYLNVFSPRLKNVYENQALSQFDVATMGVQ